MDILFEHVTAVTMDEASPVLEDAFVLVSGRKIVSVTRQEPEHFKGRRISGQNKVLMPGLVNAHTHIPMTLLRGYADGYDLQTWLNDYIFPAEAQLTERAVTAGTYLGLAEMIASGTTSFSDMYYFCDRIAQAAAAAGIQANICRAVISFDPEYRFETDQAGIELRELKERWHGYDEGRIQIEASIHGEYTSHEKVWRAVAGYAREHGLGMHVHVSETKKEHEECIARSGLTPAQTLDRAGVWDTRAQAAHCVWVSEEDLELFARKKVTAVHNPVSNQKLASGIAPVPAMLRQGVNVALGTDGVASNNCHDLFGEMKSAALIHKAATLDPTVIPALEVLKMATAGGNAAQGRNGGRIEAGMDANLILLDFDKPHLTPCHSVVSNLVFAARGSDVVLTMVRGKVLYEKGEWKTIDLDAVMHEVRNYAVPKILGRL
ncbi:amidohydrolase family protein [Papillibacter cinnamivorans]|uniref:5-methylthioadenosine/S-adenosylhomocysteine deaminase n=1 Tax=Papillibacter cinnamivorans DSM 12816 TaxID=1122930 RepID=A0A1W2A1S0_9FIRM|nr:amidohydrolase [Papillibacter cinnamivorans]SMC54669.1 5-methylthioadenosine/S-adenosylhomocysteine deaminase [Papillibacter cinnamivorans DSM 12816]